MFVHEDERRKLIEFASGEFRCCKALTVKESGCWIGDHYHRNKDERFLLLSGRAADVIVGSQHWGDVAAPFVWDVPRGNYHRFVLDAGSVLIGVATAEFDPADEIKGLPNG